MAKKLPTGFGMPEEWKHFAARHRLFFERFPSLHKVMNLAFLRKFASSEPIDRVVFVSGRLCVEDFNEISLLCGNGYGVGAMKILRGMYERTVTARYLHLHPKETNAFLNFDWVSRHKLAKKIKETFGEDLLPKNEIKKIEAKFQEVQKQFMNPKTKRLNYTWRKFFSMADKVGSIGKLIVPGYYLPTQQVHGTVYAISSRLKETQDGGLTFNEGPTRNEADDCFRTAHILLLDILALQVEHFKLDSLEQPLRHCFQDFKEIWKGKQEMGNQSGRQP